MSRRSRAPRVHLPRRIEVGTRRKSSPGEQLTCLVLCPGPDEWVAVDLASGALVRTPADAPARELLSGTQTFDVVTFPLAATPEPADPARPEAVWPAGKPEPAGRVRRGQLRRLLERLAAPELIDTPVLSSRGPSVAYVDLDGGTPSVVLVAIGKRRVELLTRADGEVACAVEWGPTTQLLPVTDPGAVAATHLAAPRSLQGGSLQQALGFRPRYLCCGLGEVRAGHVRKLVFGLLPAR